MKKKSLLTILILIVIGIGLYYVSSNYDFDTTGNIVSIDNANEKGIKIANWNLEIYGVTKASKEDLLNSYASKIDDYDIVFVQEIRDISDTAFDKLCAKLENYSCETSSRAGRTSSKEQYGIITKKGIKANYMIDYNPDQLDRWERPPIEVSFDMGSYNLTVFNIHIKPEDVKNELDHLDDVVKNEGYKMIIGDFNADCTYYLRNGQEFSDFTWVVKDNEDTTVTNTDCAYDRIILTDKAETKLLRYGIDKNVTKEQSDHYLVWAEMRK